MLSNGWNRFHYIKFLSEARKLKVHVFRGNKRAHVLTESLFKKFFPPMHPILPRIDYLINCRMSCSHDNPHAGASEQYQHTVHLETDKAISELNSVLIPSFYHLNSFSWREQKSKRYSEPRASKKSLEKDLHIPNDCHNLFESIKKRSEFK